MINWQLSKQGICWPVSPYRTAGSSVDPSTNNQFQMIAGLSLFFQWFVWNMLCLCHYGPTLLRFWFQTDLRRKNSAAFLKIKTGKTFSYHGHALVTLYVQFLCSDWFMRKIYVASWKLFTLTAEADRLLCQLVTFLTVFFHWMYKTKYSCYQESSVFFVFHLA